MTARSRSTMYKEVRIFVWQILEEKCHGLSVYQDSSSSENKKTSNFREWHPPPFFLNHKAPDCISNI